jgi:hypothetical protein
LPAEIVGSGNHAGRQVFLVVLIDVEDGLAAFGLFHAVAVAVPESSSGQAQTKLDKSLEA